MARESIGTAFVRILADGKGLPESLKREFDKTEPVMHSVGEGNARAYSDGFNREMSRGKDPTATLIERLQAGIGKFDAQGQKMGVALSSGIRDELKKSFGEDIGSRVFADLERDLNRGALSVDRLGGSFDNLRVRVARAVERATQDAKQFEREWRDTTNSIDSTTKQITRNLNTELRSMGTTFDGLRTNVDRLRVSLSQSITRDQIAAIRDTTTQYRRLAEQIDRVARGEEETHVSRRTLLRQLERLNAEMRVLGGHNEDWDRHLAEQRKRVVLMHPAILRFNRRVDTLGDSVGRLTGRGSRNNFLNWVGSVNRGVIRLASVFPNLFAAVQRVGRIFTETFDAGKAAGMGTLRAGISGLAASARAGLPGLVAVGAALGAMAITVGILTAAASMLLGIITALAASITYALLGAVSALSAALLPVAAGVGALVVAFAALNDEQRAALSRDMRPLTNAFKALGDAGADEMFKGANQWARQLAPAIRGLEPLVRDVSAAVNDVGESFARAINGPNFRRFRDALREALPDAIRSLGRSTENALGGFSGIFTVMVEPGGILDRFLGWLEKITEQFDEWANSPKGREEMRQFFRDAGDSAEALGDFLNALGESIAELFQQGRASGDNIFDSMTRSLEKFTRFLEENPDAVSQWFKDAEGFFEDIKQFGADVRGLLDALDNLQTRLGASKTLDAIGTAIEGISLLIRTLGGWSGIFFMPGLTVVTQTINGIPGTIEAVARTVDRILQGIRESFSSLKLQPPRMGAINVPIPKLDVIAQKFTGLSDKILKKIGPIGLAGLFRFPAVGFLTGPFARTAADILRKIGPIRLGGQFRFPTLGFLVAPFTGLGGHILRTIGTIRLIDKFNFPSFSQITSRFRGLARSILDAIGTIDIGSLFRFPERGGGIPFVPGAATGELLTGPAFRLVGEDGPEAIVPLDRPLSQVDPAVRRLSAIAQGLASVPSGGGGSNNRTIEVGGLTIVTPTKNPYAVAEEVVGQLAAAAYI